MRRLQLRDKACCFAKLVGREYGSHHCDERDLALSNGLVSRRRRGRGGGTRKRRGCRAGSVGSGGGGDRNRHQGKLV